MVNGDLTLLNTRLINNLNERSWQNLRKSQIENEEQWRLFDNDVSDTLRLTNMVVKDKTVVLCAAAEKEKSLGEEYLKIKIEHDKLLAKPSRNSLIQMKRKL